MGATLSCCKARRTYRNVHDPEEEEEIWNVKIDMHELDLYEEEWDDEKEGSLKKSSKRTHESEHPDNTKPVFTIGEEGDENEHHREGLLPDKKSVSGRLMPDDNPADISDLNVNPDFVDINLHSNTDNTIIVDSRQKSIPRQSTSGSEANEDSIGSDSSAEYGESDEDQDPEFIKLHNSTRSLERPGEIRSNRMY